MEMTDRDKANGRPDQAQKRELVAAYLSYALDEVGTLSPVGRRLLQMAIASLTDDTIEDVAEDRPYEFLS
jgi:hypothetical protein